MRKKYICSGGDGDYTYNGDQQDDDVDCDDDNGDDDNGDDRDDGDN